MYQFRFTDTINVSKALNEYKELQKIYQERHFQEYEKLKKMREEEDAKEYTLSEIHDILKSEDVEPDTQDLDDRWRYHNTFRDTLLHQENILQIMVGIMTVQNPFFVQISELPRMESRHRKTSFQVSVKNKAKQSFDKYNVILHNPGNLGYYHLSQKYAQLMKEYVTNNIETECKIHFV